MKIEKNTPALGILLARLQASAADLRRVSGWGLPAFSARSIAASLLLAATGASLAAPVTFIGTGVGPIPDNSLVGRTVAFDVSGLSAPISSVEIRITLTHTWAGDLTAILIAPGDVARLVVFGRPGGGLASTAGDSSDFDNTYIFNDAGLPDIVPRLQFLDGAGILAGAPAAYRTTSRGAPGRSNAGGCPTSLRGVFAGLTPAQANGAWSLLVVDSANGDVGRVGISVITLDTQAIDPIFANGFENPPMQNADAGFSPSATASPVNVDAPAGGPSAPAHCINKVQADFTGDGLTDYPILRANGSLVSWFIRENLRDGAAGTDTGFNFGATTDTLDSADLDGDRIADPLTWTPGAAGVAAYRARLSSRGGAVRTVVFGQTGDNATQSGDYDGDGIDDVAFFRTPGGGPNTLQFLRSSDGTVGSVQTNVGAAATQQFSISGFDYTGDGLADIMVQGPDTVAPNARFSLFNSAGTPISTVPFGTVTDFLIPGSYIGNPRTDLTTRRTVAGVQELRSFDLQTAVSSPLLNFGVTGDRSIGGDYDGDGISDYAFWRSSSTAGASAFQIRISSGTSAVPPTVWTTNFGQQGDFPVSGSRVQ